MKKIYIFVFSLFFIGTVFYITTQGQTNTVKFTDGAKNLDTITAGIDAITKNWADTLIVGSLDKNSGGCRIKLGNFFLPSPTEVYFWQGYSWGQATTTPDCSSAANSCICPAGTTRVLRRSQDKSINQLDTTWWKDFSYSSSGSHNFVAGWTTQCTEYSYYWPAGSPQCPGAGGPAETNSNCCGYVLNNCKDLLDSDDGCAGSQPMNYTEYIYNCVANSEILKQ
jgi:hypothetical protein